MFLSPTVKKKALDTLRQYYAAHGAGPTEPLLIEDTPLHLVTIETMKSLKDKADTLGAVKADDETIYAVVSLHSSPPARDS